MGGRVLWKGALGVQQGRIDFFNEVQPMAAEPKRPSEANDRLKTQIATSFLSGLVQLSAPAVVSLLSSPPQAMLSSMNMISTMCDSAFALFGLLV